MLNPLSIANLSCSCCFVLFCFLIVIWAIVHAHRVLLVGNRRGGEKWLQFDLIWKSRSGIPDLWAPVSPWWRYIFAPPTFFSWAAFPSFFHFRYQTHWPWTNVSRPATSRHTNSRLAAISRFLSAVTGEAASHRAILVWHQDFFLPTLTKPPYSSLFFPINHTRGGGQGPPEETHQP